MEESTSKTDEVITFKQCLRCGYRWLPRSVNRPIACPVCKRRNWDSPEVELENPEDVPGVKDNEALNIQEQVDKFKNGEQ